MAVWLLLNWARRIIWALKATVGRQRAEMQTACKDRHIHTMHKKWWHSSTCLHYWLTESQVTEKNKVWQMQTWDSNCTTETGSVGSQTKCNSMQKTHGQQKSHPGQNTHFADSQHWLKHKSCPARKSERQNNDSGDKLHNMLDCKKIKIKNKQHRKE